MRPDQSILLPSNIDDRLPDVHILSDRYFVGRPPAVDSTTNAWTAINTTKAWVCPCRIAGTVYNRSSSDCGYCGKDSSRSERTVDWDFPLKKESKNAWALEQLGADEVQPFSNKHKLSLPIQVTNLMGGLPIERSGVLFVVLMAMGFDHETSYRTAAQPFRWGNKKARDKLADVIELLIDSGELAEITARTKQIYQV